MGFFHLFVQFNYELIFNALKYTAVIILITTQIVPSDVLIFSSIRCTVKI